MDEYVARVNAMSSEEQLEKFLSYMNMVKPVEDNQEGFSLNGNKWDFIEL